MNSQEVRFSILKDAYERRKKGDMILMAPQQYSQVLGIPEDEIKLNLEYLIEEHFMNGTVDRMTGGLVIYHVASLTPKGIDAAEHWSLFATPQAGNMTVHVEGSMNQVALGSGINQSQSAMMIETYQDAYKYVEGKFTKGQAELIIQNLKVLEVELDKDAFSRRTMKNMADFATKYGPVFAPVMDFVLRAVGLKI